MKHHLLYFLLISFVSHSLEKDTVHPAKSIKKNDILQDAAEIYHQLAYLLHSSATIKSERPQLDKYRCGFILGCLSEKRKRKLYDAIPDEIGALVAQKKHIGKKKLSLKEELELSKWEANMMKKLSNPSKA